MFSSIITNLQPQKVSLLIRNTFKSAISLDKLYPKSNQSILEKFELKQEKQVDKDGKESFTGFIPIDKLQITHKTCRKPGGQNVNKSNTGIEIRFHVDTATWIPDWIREKLKEQQSSKITKDGYLIVSSEKTRKNLLNQADCLERIRACIREASKEPKGLNEHDLLKIEINKKVAEGRRLNEKRRKSEIKSYRRSNVFDRYYDTAY